MDKFWATENYGKTTAVNAWTQKTNLSEKQSKYGSICINLIWKQNCDQTLTQGYLRILTKLNINAIANAKFIELD